MSQRYVTVRRPIQGKSKYNIVSVFDYHAPKVNRKIEVTLHAFYFATLRRRSLKVTFTTYEQEGRQTPVVRTALSYKHPPPPPKKFRVPWIQRKDEKIHKNIILRNRDGVVSIETKLRAGRFGVRIPSGAKQLFSSPKRPDRLWGPPSILSHGYMIPSPL